MERVSIERKFTIPVDVIQTILAGYINQMHSAQTSASDIQFEIKEVCVDQDVYVHVLEGATIVVKDA